MATGKTLAQWFRKIFTWKSKSSDNKYFLLDVGSKVVVDLRKLKHEFPKLPIPDSVCGVITVINQCCWWISLDDDATFDHFKELIWANRELQQWVSTPFGG